MDYILALDQGTTSTRALIFDADRRLAAMAQIELPQIYPAPGWVEHDAALIFSHACQCIREALGKASLQARDIAAIGIANQRETTVLWDRYSGRPVANAIVWQDRRTAGICQTLAESGHAGMVSSRTGLRLDPYFSGTKLAWLVKSDPAIAQAASQGRLLFGTIDSWLIWKLSGGQSHRTDATNASRTLLYNIHSGTWDGGLLDLLGIEPGLLPEIRDTDGNFGMTDPALFGAAIPIRAAIGDQQAAAIAQGCMTQGDVKATYGTGCFVLLNTGAKAVPSRNRLLTTVALQRNGIRSYAIEGSIFVAGAAIQWLRDGLRIIASAPEADILAQQARGDSEIYLVPAFAGLGAPYWDAHARGALIGLTRDTGPAEIARATVESVAYQTRDLLTALASDLGPAHPIARLRTDGGMSRSDFMLKLLADLTGCIIERPAASEATAAGAAWIAGSACGLYPPLEQMAQAWKADKVFAPEMPQDQRDAKYAGWQKAVARVCSH